MVVERGAVRRSKILSLLCAESMRWNMKLICEGTMLAIVPFGSLAINSLSYTLLLCL